MNTKELFDAASAQAFPDGSEPSIDDIRERVKDGTISDAAAAMAVAMTSPPSRAYTADGRFTDDDITAQQELLDAYKAQGRLWGSIRYANVQSLLDEVKASRAASAPNAEHATMAEAVGGIVNASVVLARIERKVDALGTDNPTAPLVANLVELVKAMSERVSLERNPCRSCGADPSTHPPSGQEVPVVRGALDAQARAESSHHAIAELLAATAEEVERHASSVGITAVGGVGDASVSRSFRIRSVVAQMVARLRPITPLPAPSQESLDLGQRAYREAFGEYAGHPSNPDVWTWWTVGIGHDTVHALKHDDPPALRHAERLGDEWKPANWTAFRDAVRRLHAETPAP